MAILWLGDEACDDVQLVGGKAANSSRLASGYRVPAGFCITPDLYQAWLTTRDQGLGPNQDLRDLVSRLSMYSLLVSIPLLLSRDDSSLRIGLILFVISAGMTVSSYAGGRLICRLAGVSPPPRGWLFLPLASCRWPLPASMFRSPLC
jgi:hypothetical protein